MPSFYVNILSGAGAALFYAGFGIYVVVRNNRSYKNIKFAFFCFNYALYNLSTAMLFAVGNSESARIWMEINSRTGVMLPVTLYMWLMEYVNPHKKAVRLFKDALFWIIVCLTLFFQVAFIFHLVNVGVVNHGVWYYAGKSILLLPSFLLFLLLITILLNFRLYRSYRNCRDKFQRSFYLVIMTGISAAITLGIGDTFSLSRMQQSIPFLGAGSGLILIPFLLFSYFRFKKQILVDITLMNSSLRLTLYVVLAAFILSLGIFIPLFTIFPAISRTVYFVFLILLLNSIVYTFLFFSYFENRLFIPRDFNSLPKRLIKSDENTSVIRELTSYVVKNFGAAYARIFLQSELEMEKEELGEVLGEVKTIIGLNAVFELIQFVKQRRKTVYKYSVIKWIKHKTRQQILLDGFTALHADICIPLLSNNAVTGLFFIGSRTPDRHYTRQEIVQLTTIVNMATIALDNIRLKTQLSDRVTDLAHELITPLTSINIFAGFIKKNSSADPNMTMAARLIVSETERYAYLINNLQLIANLEISSSLFLDKTEVQLEKIIADVSTLFKFAMEKKAIVFSIPVYRNLPSVWADESRIKQVLINIFSNSVKYTRGPGEIKIALLYRNNWMKVEILDKGIGIKKRDIKKILTERYFRTKAAKATGVGGIGIGLKICNHIIKAHGGRFYIKNRNGGGTIVGFLLPLKKDSPGKVVPAFTGKNAVSQKEKTDVS